ncbi:uncharacterized protein [Apostichopus japonicus]|uniref:uncharacterized protein n=1 Tax=Stichopus japonicus TaxID=307972 RepID=UPI003AB2E6B5
MKMSTRKDKIMERLREKLRLRQRENRTTEGSTHRSSRMQGNKNAAKAERRVDVGWLHLSKGDTYKQVRIQNGGGIRRLIMPKAMNVSHVLEEAKKLFFPDGLSPKGTLADFKFEMMDVRKLPFVNNPTIEEMYETTKLSVLRMYISTKEIERDESTSGEASCEETDQVQDVDETVHVSDDSGDEIPAIDLHVMTDVGSEVTVGTSQQVMTELSDLTTYEESEINLSGHPSNELPSGTPTIVFRPSALAASDCHIDDKHTKKTFVIRRTHVFEDFIEFFKDPQVPNSAIEIRMVLPNGEIELGEGSGVYADAFTAFWEEFAKYSTGDQFKVPSLRHDFDANSWESVGRIISKGWKDMRYFPLSLSPPFMEEAIFGKSEGDMKDAFLQYISVSEKMVIVEALTHFPEGASYDELIDILDGYGCRVLVTKRNLPQILYEIGHKEIIQKPMFIADSMRETLEPLREELTPLQLRELYKNMMPTSQKVISRIKVPQDISEGQHVVFSYLKKYIRSLEKDKLQKFLRFWTGADVLSFPQLNVSFNLLDGFARRPVAHTCSQCLELPTTYESYIDMKNELNQVLDSGIWVMDIV